MILAFGFNVINVLFQQMQHPIQMKPADSEKRGLIFDFSFSYFSMLSLKRCSLKPRSILFIKQRGILCFDFALTPWTSETGISVSELYNLLVIQIAWAKELMFVWYEGFKLCINDSQIGGQFLCG